MLAPASLRDCTREYPGKKNEPIREFLKVVAALRQRLFLCEATKALYQHFLRTLVGLMFSDATLNSFKSGLEDADCLVLRAASKRRRADEVLSLGVATEVLSNGLATSSTAFCRAHPLLLHDPAKATNLFDIPWLRGYYVALNLTFSDCQILSLVYDCFRGGNPSVEHLVIAAENVIKGRSAWLPLMDTRMGDHFEFGMMLA